ncbi:MAG: 7-cyano-7-deazaguanine synthase QueC [Pseudomonadota bacterium]
MQKAIVLLSGGLDSTTCLAYAKSQGYECYALSFAYGQKHSVELQAAENIAKFYRVAQHQIITIELGNFAHCALTDEKIKIEDYKAGDQIPTTYVPARNTVFLAYALGFAEVVNATAIFIGANAIDYSGYPDCRPEYIAAFQSMANLATKQGVEGQKVTIETPLIDLEKKQIIQLGLSLKVDYAMTISCYRANATGLACGSCDSCHYRKKGFQELGVTDPTRYIDTMNV